MQMQEDAMTIGLAVACESVANGTRRVVLVRRFHWPSPIASLSFSSDACARDDISWLLRQNNSSDGASILANSSSRRCFLAHPHHASWVRVSSSFMDERHISSHFVCWLGGLGRGRTETHGTNESSIQFDREVFDSGAYIRVSSLRRKFRLPF